MTERFLAQPQPRSLSSEEVEEYLLQNPDFLARRPDLLAELIAPSARHGDNVADFQQVMIDRLRDRLDAVEEEHHALVATARGNLASQERIHGAALEILGAPTFEQLIEAVTTDVPMRLGVDVAALCVESEEAELPLTVRRGVRVFEPGSVDALIGPGRDAVLRSHIEGDPAVFGQGAGLVRSDALLRFKPSAAAPTGMLALGSRDPEFFVPGQGTELLGFLARVLEATIRAWLDLPA